MPSFPKVDWRLYFAKWLMRVGRFCKATNPGWWVAMLAFGGFLAEGAFLNGLDGHYGFYGAIRSSFVRGFQGGSIAFFVVYIVWESIQFFKWIHQWASSYIAKQGGKPYEQSEG
jgi:hypothetical protein